MALVEAVLVYRPYGVRGDDPIPIGRTGDHRVLRIVRDRLLEEAVADARAWRKIDPGVAAMRAAEVERLAEILRFFVPDEDPEPRLRLVKSEENGEER